MQRKGVVILEIPPLLPPKAEAKGDIRGLFIFNLCFNYFQI